jgi:prevent-host-death family protein
MIMERVGLREANIHFAKYIKKVKEGKKILLTDRGKPIAVVSPLATKEEPIEGRLRLMEERGILKRPTGKLKLRTLINIPGKEVSRIVSENREERS